MEDPDLQLLAINLPWQRLLEAYLELNSEPLPAGESGPRWSPRIISMNEVTPQELSGIHGQLIALGWLHFQLEDGQAGLTYRVSPDGRRALARLENYIAHAEENASSSDESLAA
ncbi:hypothetical protein [Planctomicrobium piriforme]|uniref:Uncharacterized protein n=1 Tax=Planctomicrobium piriforme TaxID=1576369 RepID=A0A1I3J995_9PLAN|nr:hypothetical protein [Planctomicrobium piriforme]SFI56763.1 hypothetical protein SAMN05421753_11099 [Planctomicrobium piriforme]